MSTRSRLAVLLRRRLHRPRARRDSTLTYGNILLPYLKLQKKKKEGSEYHVIT